MTIGRWLGLEDIKTFFAKQIVKRVVFIQKIIHIQKVIPAHMADVLGLHSFRWIFHVFFAQFLDIWFHVNLHSAAFQLAAQIVMKVSTSSVFCSILKARSYTTKHGRRSRKNSLVLDSMLISVSSTFQAQISGSPRPYTKNCFNSC